MAKVDVSSEIVIACTLNQVANYAADPDNVPAWYVNIKSVEWKTPRPVAVGTRVAFVAHFLGRRLAYTYEVVEFVPGERLVMRTTEGPFPMETSYAWKAVNGQRTHMTLRNRGEPTGFCRLISPFMSWMIRKANRKDLACLKRLLESTDDNAEPDPAADGGG